MLYRYFPATIVLAIFFLSSPQHDLQQVNQRQSSANEFKLKCKDQLITFMTVLFTKKKQISETRKYIKKINFLQLGN